MDYKIKNIKKEARELLCEKWNTAVLGFFVPFLLGVILSFSSYTAGEMIYETGEGVLFCIFDVFLTSFIQSLISYSFLVGVYNFLIFSKKSEKNDVKSSGGFFRILLVSFSSFGRVIVPVIITRVVFSMLDFMLSIEYAVVFYDVLLFAYVSYPVYMIATQVLRVFVTAYFLYINMVYIFTPCILAENPFIRGCDAMQISRRISKGHKWKLVLLELSFLGWMLLGGLAFAVGMFFALAYSAAAICAYYQKIRPEMKVIKNMSL